MNENVNKARPDAEVIEDARARLNTYKDDSGESWSIIAGKVGLGQSTLTAFAKETYAGDNMGVAAELLKWFRTEETQELFGHALMRPGFLMTATARYVTGHLTFAKLGNIATVVGEPGVGKTSTLREFARVNSHVWIVTASPARSGYNAFFAALLIEMNAPHASRAGFLLSERARRLLKARSSPLLIVDEAQYLSENVLEELRAIHDDTGCGILFCGNRMTTARIDGNRTAQFAQRSSRVGKRGDLSVPRGNDVAMILDAWGVTDDHERRLLTTIAMRPGGGAIRQITMILEQATLVARAEKVQRNLLHIKDAADDLNAGMAA